MGTLKKKGNIETYESVSEGLRTLYHKKLLPLEEHSKFHELQAPKLLDSEFDAKPMVLLIGQYSTGKTTFIRHIIGDSYAGMRIGPEPTTDGFVIVMHGDTERVIPGNALVVDPKKPFQSLSMFGNNFLKRLTCAESPLEFLKSVSIIDTPGILSGDKQRIARGYEFGQVICWLAERVDRVYLLFDAHKLDISDEFRGVIEILKPFDTKIRLILNKADSVTPQQLMRVYGALMWSLGKIINTPEVTRVYIGSFWSEKYQVDEYRNLFEAEQKDLLDDLRTLPKQATLRRLNDYIRRTRLAVINYHIVGYLQKEMPIFGKEKKKAELINDLPKIFQTLSMQLHLSIGDFPDVPTMQEQLKLIDFSKFKKSNPKLLSEVQEMINTSVQHLMELIPKEERDETRCQEIKGGVFTNIDDSRDNITNPFSLDSKGPFGAVNLSETWVVEEHRFKYDPIFESLKHPSGFVTGAAARAELIKKGLPNAVLGHIWNLADCDKDGKLSKDEWALCLYLCDLKLQGQDIPHQLPDHFKPPM